MARTDSLTNFLTDVANAIRAKKGTSDPIPAANFDTEILTIISVLEGDNLLDLLEANAEFNSYEGSEASVTFNNNNTLTVTADGSSSWGLDISQPNLTLEAGKTYKLSCNNIADSTWISINNDSDKMISRDVPTIEFTVNENIVNPTLIIWVSSGVIYSGTVWDIKLIERVIS